MINTASADNDSALFDQAKEFLHSSLVFSSTAPSVTVTFAQSLDGKIAKPNERIILSGHESMAMTHRLRAMHDAILVGINTVLCDDPRLNVRLVPGDTHAHPRPIVLDSRLTMPLSARLVTSGCNPWVFTSPDHCADRRLALERLGVRVVVVKEGAHGLCLDDVLAKLHKMGIRKLMVEGGAKVIRAFLEEGKAHNLVITTAPVFVGSGVSAMTSEDGFANLTISPTKYQAFGNDIVMVAKVQYS
ncbi:2,5-diamino-6-(ribosylamino)-4(3H)-pyrimidinone 5'-phosphate reductase [Coemansia spiralis]|uniref:2,5-diamino-6-ribosylamino-4(3H)-pyrimidinone 5'-phosphate reductase n=2 Tax=Coemansia TaxID=4863 RepID=A0A9W8KY50_9FUNG|nr:dihydrofolate reductase-like domain-containing protein [Coemansia spiralis]KAJ1991393.1 2,5-diamino-6-(ribosylamino)-4(3H)-pyrimidinone 5'-phosphate reductase [Coemansia umbellata]KAJ2624949.1 2,5-diamino-6-(ribosylamino)-4(3H)-pyrimidinone 5'-phosphate reductase [Coemansia sp. RSA 1358]KAJ2679143.1 2,5-diamino-6-(ribosylamino)-4(3H)-pyrimidinone 5'-phosphate reductase [Coemansia spiralis]